MAHVCPGLLPWMLPDLTPQELEEIEWNAIRFERRK